MELKLRSEAAPQILCNLLIAPLMELKQKFEEKKIDGVIAF